MFGKIRAVRIGLCAFLTAIPMITLGAEHESGATDGRELYMNFQCWQCHGYEGQGGAAPRLRQSAYPYEAFVRFVRFPNVMPAYPSELLADADLQAIYAYLQSLPEPPAVDDLPALRDL